MKMPDKWYTKLSKPFQRSESSAAECSAHIPNHLGRSQINFLYPFFSDKLLFSPSQAHFSNLTFSEFATFHCACFQGLSSGEEVLLFLFSFFFFPRLFFEFAQSYQGKRKVEQRVEQTRFRDKQNSPSTAGDGNYSGSGNQAASLRLCKVHSKSQSLSSQYFLSVCQAVRLSVSSSQKIQILKESTTPPLTRPFFVLSPLIRFNSFAFGSSF